MLRGKHQCEGMWMSADTTAGETAWRRWDGIGSSGQVVEWLERMSLETSASNSEEKENKKFISHNSEGGKMSELRDVNLQSWGK